MGVATTTLATRLRAYRAKPPVKQAIALGKEILFTRTVAYRAWTLAQPRLRRGEIRLDDLTASVDAGELPPLDRNGASPQARTDRQRHWTENGYLILERAIPEEVVDEYVRVRAKLPEALDASAYIQVPAMREVGLHPAITAAISEVIGEEMGLSLSLSNWTSTERNWHQDEYLNPPVIKAHYLAAWIALEDIDPDSGPFEFVPASHKWGILSRERVQRFMTLKDVRSPMWPKRSEQVLNGVFEELIAERGLESKQFIGKKGDVLIWHTCLAHRGTEPRDRTLKRKALICHYTALSRGSRYYPRIGTAATGGKFFYYDDYE